MGLLFSNPPVSVDDVTINRNATGQLQIKDGGVSEDLLTFEIGTYLTVHGIIGDVTAGAWTNINDSAQLFAMQKYSNGADGDAISLGKIPLMKGTYNIYFISKTDGTRGIADIKLDSTVIDSHDTYSAGLARNVVFKTTAYAVATSGIYDLNVVVNGKNGASSDHYVDITAIFIERTA